jgi:hypothetical protein
MHGNNAEAREILRMIERDREWRRSHPERFLAEIAADLWRNLPDEEAVDDFRLRAQSVPWWASDLVECLQGIVQHRPAWAARTLVEASRRGPWLGPSPDDTPEVYLDWLAKQLGRMKAPESTQVIDGVGLSGRGVAVAGPDRGPTTNLRS